MRIAVITCKKDPDYIRARTLRVGFGKYKNTEIIEVKNKPGGHFKLLSIYFKLIKVRIAKDPDVYVITFRGYGVLPLVLILANNRPVIFDEFVNPLEWLAYEHHKIRPDGFWYRLIRAWYRFWIKKCHFILADTEKHAEYSARLNRISLDRYKVVPVGTDEKLFYPNSVKKKNKKFTVFYYGEGMLPLHGLSYVIEAALRLRSNSDINFLIVGGGKNTRTIIEQAVSKGALIEYKSWIPFDKLSRTIRSSDLCLGGPFGNTVQAKRVITGKTFQFLACSKPVILGKTLLTGPFVSGQDSIIVNQGNSRMLAEAIEWCSKNKRRVNVIAKNGYKTYQRDFSNNVIIKYCRELLDEIL